MFAYPNRISQSSGVGYMNMSFNNYIPVIIAHKLGEFTPTFNCEDMQKAIVDLAMEMANK